jgi:hypothetical protein
VSALTNYSASRLRRRLSRMRPSICGVITIDLARPIDRGAAALLRKLAKRGLSIRAAQVDKYPLPCGARRALAGSGADFARGENGSPTPARFDAGSNGGVSEAGRFLHRAEQKIAANTKNDGRETCRQKCAHGQSSGSPKPLGIMVSRVPSTRGAAIIRNHLLPGAPRRWIKERTS